MRRRGPLAGVAALLGVLILIGTLAGCSDDDRRADGARAAARAYVQAIATLDLDTANAMSSTDAFRYQDPALDVRAALPDAAAPITNPWVEFAGQDDDGAYVFSVSYLIGELTGGDTIKLEYTGRRAEQQGKRDLPDPSRPESWRVIEPLIATSYVYHEDENHEGANARVIFGSAEVSANEHVWGYPAAYVVKPADVPDGFAADSLRVPLGAPDSSRWNLSLPQVGTHATPRLTKMITADLRRKITACLDTDRPDSPACDALPEDLRPSRQRNDSIRSGHFQPLGKDDLTVHLHADRDSDWIDVTGKIIYVVDQGTHPRSGASAAGEHLVSYLDAIAVITVAGGSYDLDWD